MRKIAITSIVVVAIAAGALIVVLTRGDRYHTKERRQWKSDSIAAIRNDLKDLDYLKKRFGEIPKPVSEFDTSESNWLVSDTIVPLCFRCFTFIQPQPRDQRWPPLVGLPSLEP